MATGSEFEGWIVVHETSTDYEADMVRDRLDSEGIPAVVFTQRDHAFNLTVGTLATVRVMVPPEHADAARALLQQKGAFSEGELDEAARESYPGKDYADEETLTDSGNESLHLSPPEEEEDADEERRDERR